MKRLLIYFAYDEDGVMDAYIGYALGKLRPFAHRVVVVVNGELTPESRAMLDRHADEVIVRENVGFDVWAYKTAIDHVGWAALEQYDELVLMNHTLMGPVHDLAPMFAAMDTRTELDFWGITQCFAMRDAQAVRQWGNPYGYIPEHIQSSFTAFRRRLFASAAFHELWDAMPMIPSYSASGGQYEQVITKKFADLGFSWACYTDYSGLSPDIHTCCPLINAPLEVVRDLKSPFFKRRTFFTSIKEHPASVPSTRAFWDYLGTTDYDRKMVMDNLLRTRCQRDIARALLMLTVTDGVASCAPCRKAAFVCMKNIVNRDKVRAMLDTLRGEYNIYISDEPGGDAAGLFTGVPASFADYDYVLLVNPPASAQGEDMRRYAGRQAYAVEALLGERRTANAMIDLLQREPLAGMVSFPQDFVQSSNWDAGERWAQRYHQIETWLAENGLRVPIAMDSPPVVGLSGTAVIRCGAVANLCDLAFDQTDGAFACYALALLCQANGALPVHALPRILAQQALMGYEELADLHEETAQIKRDYYEQMRRYNDQLEATVDSLRTSLEAQRESYRMLEAQQNMLRGQFAQKDAYCQALTQALEEQRESYRTLEAQQNLLREQLKEKEAHCRALARALDMRRA